MILVTDKYLHSLTVETLEKIHGYLIQFNDVFYKIPLKIFIASYNLWSTASSIQKEYDIANLIVLFDNEYIENCVRSHLIMTFIDKYEYPTEIVIAALLNMKHKLRYLDYIIEYAIQKSPESFNVFNNDLMQLIHHNISIEGSHSIESYDVNLIQKYIESISKFQH
jgi:hypothetical protein